jgi:hypothetical protein
LLVQRWLGCIYTVGTRGAPPLQCVFLYEIESARARAVAALVRGLGLEVRVPDAEKAGILVEVRRPEGVILSGLLGTPQDPTGPADGLALQMNRAKDDAEKAGDAEQQQRIGSEERAALEHKLAPAAGAQERGSRLVVQRSVNSRPQVREHAPSLLAAGLDDAVQAVLRLGLRHGAASLPADAS